MGTCCSTISKRKRHKQEDVYDPEEANQKMIIKEVSAAASLSTFDADNVKRALSQTQEIETAGAGDDTQNAPPVRLQKSNSFTSKIQKTFGN
jgi:hypothetical protein